MRSRLAPRQGGTQKFREVKRDSGHFRVFSKFGSFLLHVLRTLILEVVHMVFFLCSENSQ